MTSAEDLDIESVLSMPFAENTYIAHISGRDDCLIFDPGLEPGKIIEVVERHGWQPAAFLNTHGHADHIGGNHAMKERWPDVPLVIGRREAEKLTDAMLNLSGVFGAPITSPPADVLLDEGEIYTAAGFPLEVLHTPGHSSGHVVFVYKEVEPYVVFGGDVLFAGSIGRVDFPGCSLEQLAASIHEKLFVLPDETVVLAGHGEPTTVGAEKRTNPFVGAPAGYAM